MYSSGFPRRLCVPPVLDPQSTNRFFPSAAAYLLTEADRLQRPPFPKQWVGSLVSPTPPRQLDLPDPRRRLPRYDHRHLSLAPWGCQPPDKCEGSRRIDQADSAQRHPACFQSTISSRYSDGFLPVGRLLPYWPNPDQPAGGAQG